MKWEKFVLFQGVVSVFTRFWILSNTRFFLLILFINVTGCKTNHIEKDDSSITTPLHAKWELTFSDDFKGNTLDEQKWNKGFGWGMKSGSFDEGIDPSNIQVQNSKLILKLENRPVSGGNYASGAVNTKNKFYQKYGFFEARIKVPKGMGFLSAFWAKSNDERWPPEIDFIEILGKETNKSHFTVHFSENGQHKSSGRSWTGPDFSTDFHVFGCEWNEEKIVWYIDGEERGRTSDGIAHINETDQPFYLMLNVHIGHDWPGRPDASTPWPSYMEIDWVRAYKKKL